MRKFTFICLTLFFFISFTLPVFATPKTLPCEIALNDQCVNPSTPLLEVKGHILIPLEWFAKAMGASSVTWDKDHSTVTVVVDDFFKAHEYLSFLNGLQYAQNDYPLPPRLQNLNLPAYPLYNTNPPMLNSSPIGLNIVSGDLTMPWAVYDYQIKNDTLYVGMNWLNTLFLAQIEQTPTSLLITYPTSEVLDQDIAALKELTMPLSPEEALALFIHGQQNRNGALQYAALSPFLKEKALTYLHKQGWVTGASSPSLEEATITSTSSPDESTFIYEVTYKERNGTHENSQIHQKLTIKKHTINNQDYWFITDATGDLDYYSVLSE